MSQYAGVSQSDIPDRINSNVPLAVASLVGRVLLSAIYLVSGFSKLAAPAATIGYITSAGLPFAPLGLAIAVVVEILGGAALIVGYRTRFVAAVLAVFTVATALGFHSNLADQSQFIHFFKKTRNDRRSPAGRRIWCRSVWPRRSPYLI